MCAHEGLMYLDNFNGIYSGIIAKGFSFVLSFVIDLSGVIPRPYGA
jgi:hypothetical protein